MREIGCEDCGRFFNRNSERQMFDFGWHDCGEETDTRENEPED